MLYYAGFSWLSKQNNDFGGNWIYVLFLYSALCPMWVIVSRISKNILFDGMLYDNLMFLTYVGVMTCMGCGSKLVTHQWFGVILVIIGSMCMRIK